MSKEEIGGMVLKYQELKNQHSCLRVKLERINGQVEDAAKRIDFVLTDSDWESSDEPGVPGYPTNTAVEELIEEYKDMVHEIDRLTDYFWRLGMKVG